MGHTPKGFKLSQHLFQSENKRSYFYDIHRNHRVLLGGEKEITIEFPLQIYICITNLLHHIKRLKFCQGIQKIYGVNVGEKNVHI
jgi:hypothetical protein